MLCICNHIYDLLFTGLFYCGHATYFLYDSRVSETLGRKSLSETGDFPDYALQMMDNIFTRCRCLCQYVLCSASAAVLSIPLFQIVLKTRLLGLPRAKHELGLFLLENCWRITAQRMNPFY